MDGGAQIDLVTLHSAADGAHCGCSMIFTGHYLQIGGDEGDTLNLSPKPPAIYGVRYKPAPPSAALHKPHKLFLPKMAHPENGRHVRPFPRTHGTPAPGSLQPLLAAPHPRTPRHWTRLKRPPGPTQGFEDPRVIDRRHEADRMPRQINLHLRRGRRGAIERECIVRGQCFALEGAGQRGREHAMDPASIIDQRSAGVPMFYPALRRRPEQPGENPARLNRRQLEPGHPPVGRLHPRQQPDRQCGNLGRLKSPLRRHPSGRLAMATAPNPSCRPAALDSRTAPPAGILSTTCAAVSILFKGVSAVPLSRTTKADPNIFTKPPASTTATTTMDFTIAASAA